jgi:hypothetical protein
MIWALEHVLDVLCLSNADFALFLAQTHTSLTNNQSFHPTIFLRRANKFLSSISFRQTTKYLRILKTTRATTNKLNSTHQVDQIADASNLCAKGDQFGS